MLDLIDALQGEFGFALVVATHDADVAAGFTREVELEDGIDRPRGGADVRIAVPLALAELVRAPGRTLVRVLTLAAAVGLLAAMLLFVGHSLGTMTASAVRSVPIDWQGPVGSARAAAAIARAVAAQPGVAEAAATATAPFAGVEHVSRSLGRSARAPARSSRSRPATSAHIDTFRFLRGSLKPGQIVFDQQLAATLQVQPGDTITLTPRQRASRRSGCASAGSRS